MTGASDKGYFTEADSAEVVIGRNDPTKNPRLAEVMAVIVRHLHAAVKEIEPTQEEWFAAIQFLTKTGHTCTDWRQEFILLSDILGVSMLVDAINSRRPTGATENTVLVLLCHKGGCRSRAGSHIERHDQAFVCFSRCRK
jgi:hydroxyquinol 1,2-dioxygenase